MGGSSFTLPLRNILVLVQKNVRSILKGAGEYKSHVLLIVLLVIRSDVFPEGAGAPWEIPHVLQM